MATRAKVLSASRPLPSKARPLRQCPIPNIFLNIINISIDRQRERVYKRKIELCDRIDF